MGIRFIKLLSIILALAGCSAPALLLTEQDLAFAPVNGKHENSEALNKGYYLYANKCGSCHYLYRPVKFTEEKWIKEMPEMAQRTKITADEQSLILKYLLTKREVELSKQSNHN